MAVKIEVLESELIDAVCARVRDLVAPEQAGPCEAFVRQYYRWVAPDELAGRSHSDLCGAAIAHWRLALERRGGEALVRVYNPDRARDGWRSPHTVLELVCDDMPFVVDSVTMTVNREGYGTELLIHPVMRVQRNGRGRLTGVLAAGVRSGAAIAESVLHAELTHEPDQHARERLRERIERVLAEVRAAVEDWHTMRSRAAQIVEELDARPPPLATAELQEGREFLRWLADDHFTFLGYREYDLATEGGQTGLRVRPHSGLGILRAKPSRAFTPLKPRGLVLARAPQLLVVTKANSRATVHRPSYLDYIGVKRFAPDGRVQGERRFLGLFTHVAYRESPRRIPLLRGKVEAVLERAGFPPDSHDAKTLTEILETYPRDSLFQVGREELFELAIGVLRAGERQRLRLFVRADPLDRFVACLVLIPRERFNTQSRERVGRILTEAFDGSQLDWSLQLSESVLARVHYVVRCPQGVPRTVDVKDLERRLARAIRAWTDDLRDALAERFGEERGPTLYKRYENAFPPAYRDDRAASEAALDVDHIERLLAEGGPVISLNERSGKGEVPLRFKLVSAVGVALSDVLPMLEHMGVRVVEERPYEVRPAASEAVWVYDFGLRCAVEDLERVREQFERAFLGVWRGELEDDGLNGLVLAAGLSGREIVILRAVAKYLRGAGIAYSRSYMERTLIAHPDIARLLVRLFVARFDPEGCDPQLAERLRRGIELAIDSIPSLDEDRILRAFLSVLGAILRTNYFRTEEPGPADGLERDFISFKLDPEQIPLLPLPRPRFEIFVYSPRVEGVHLRGGRVARGGLRWSERPEDYRTEVLGLMKAQMVKNALIVPVGSKGGFIVKRPPAHGGGEALIEEAIACYRMFLSGLLDLTDNVDAAGRIVAPPQVVRYDGDDPYLVVAADKGTATFSDIANGVSADYGFWLGDAFASGGSRGYDHKAIGITARGAWESVKRHFRELGTDVQTTDFTVVGIGDMSGDVFGNGMLRSRHIKLLAAFNHTHVFLDPDPDPQQSFAERQRLFELGRSRWSDYNPALISAGGGVHERTAKSIPLSPQIRRALAIDAQELAPNELIAAILKAPVDLLWNGGIGTYVKARAETHAEAGDKANDAVRVNGDELRCRVVGEGGNLGFTQRGRVEFALKGGPDGRGGRINTDAIDNVAGVNCSDHEVNIKILLDGLRARGELTEDERNQLLVEMTDAVAGHVLYGSYTQTQALSLALAQAAPMVDVHARLIRRLEQVAGLNRQLESLPSEEAIEERKALNQGLVAPEIAVVMAYSKIHTFAELLESDLPEDPYLSHDLERYFPPPLPQRYASQMREHPLRREIVATVVANQLVDRAGTTFSFRLWEETGAPVWLLARGYAVAREVFDMRSFWERVEALDNQLSAAVQIQMLIEGRRLVERSTRWLVRTHPRRIDIEATISRFKPGAAVLADACPGVLGSDASEAFHARVAELVAAGAPAELAARAAQLPLAPAVFDIVEVAGAVGRPFQTVMETYFALGSRLALTWLRDRIVELPRANRWQSLSRAALREDLDNLQREITRAVLRHAPKNLGAEEAITAWREQNGPALGRALQILDDIRASRTYDTTTLQVALREVRDLAAAERA